MSIAAASPGGADLGFPRPRTPSGRRRRGRSCSSSATARSLTTTPLLCGTGQDAQLGDCPPTGSPAEKGLTRDALLVLRCTKAKFPSLTDFGGKRPDPLPDHPSGRAVDIMIPNYTTAEGQAFGWQVAHWLKDNRQALGVQYLIFDAKIWSVERHAEGWRPYSPGYTGSINDSSLHRNHVHVTVYGDAGTGFQVRRRRTARWPRGSGRWRCRRAPTPSAARSPATCPRPGFRTPARTSRPRSAPRCAAPTRAPSRSAAISTAATAATS